MNRDADPNRLLDMELRELYAACPWLRPSIDEGRNECIDYIRSIADAIKKLGCAEPVPIEDLLDFEKCDESKSYRFFRDIDSDNRDPGDLAERLLPKRGQVIEHLLKRPVPGDDAAGHFFRRMAYMSVFNAAALCKGLAEMALGTSAVLMENIATCPSAQMVAGLGTPIGHASDEQARGSTTRYVYLGYIEVPLCLYFTKFLPNPYLRDCSTS